MAKENKKELNKIEGINIPGLSKEKNDAVAKASAIDEVVAFANAKKGGK